MKKFLTFVAMALLLVGCAKEYNDSAIREAINDLQIRVTALESNIDAIQSAIGDGVFVAKVQEYVDPDTGKTIGVTVTYTNGEVKHFKISPEEGYAGPVLGIITNGAGDLVWAVDGVAIKIDDKEVPVYQTPAFTIDDEGNLWVSIDGADPVNLGPVTDGGATLEDGIFTDIKVLQDKIVLTLSDGSTVNIPFAEAFKLVIANEEYAYNGLEKVEIPYTVSAKTANTVVNVIGYDPKDFTVEVTAEKIVIEPLRYGVSAVMMAYADSQIGLTSVVKLVVEPKGVVKVDPQWSTERDIDYVIDGEGGNVKARVVSNINFTVEPQESWIHHVSTKGQLYVITLSVDENNTTEEREGDIVIMDAQGFIVQMITILQGPGEPVPAGPANLSKKGAANSYIVTEAGDYMFAAVKGNSIESVGAVASAEIVWETWNNAEEVTANSVIASVAYAGGYITFSTPEVLKAGNALIAAKDADGKILWSWHIWVPATTVNNVTSSIWPDAMMDRNLGALVVATADDAITVESFGLSYQWGRKDPFVGAGAMGTDGNATVAGVAVSATDGAGEAEESKITLQQSIENPTLLGHKKNSGWLDEVNNALWKNDEKTIYDPCPPGYRVPARDKAQPWHGDDLSAVAGWAEATNWFKVGEPAVVFPFAGYRDDYSPGSLCHAYDRAVYWTAYASAESGETAYYVNVRKGSAHKLAEAGKSRGGSVRCVVDNGEPVIPPAPKVYTDLSKKETANSYMVNEAGDYKFATVKGNSNESVGAVASAEIVWETWNNAEEVTANSVIASVAYAGGYITFSTPEVLKAGNALIAAKDADGKILWSWHIWVPATTVNNVTSSIWPDAMMDRNLGALVVATADDAITVESFGLSYQWGRKDPFVGAGAMGTDGNATVAGVAVSATDGAGEAEESKITLQQSIENPTLLGHKKNSGWLDEVNNALWKNDEKTIYDPCPPGYRVPARDKAQPWHGDDLSAVAGWAEATNWFKVGEPAVVFPFAGYRDDYSPGSLCHAYDRAVYWTAYASAESGETAYYVNVRKGSAHKLAEAGKSRGGSVRCVVIPVAAE